MTKLICPLLILELFLIRYNNDVHTLIKANCNILNLPTPSIALSRIHYAGFQFKWNVLKDHIHNKTVTVWHVKTFLRANDVDNLNEAGKQILALS